MTTLQQFRKNAGLVLRKVAEAMDVTERTVWSWEHGYTEPSSSNLQRLAELYGTTMEALAAALVAKKGEVA